MGESSYYYSIESHSDLTYGRLTTLSFSLFDFAQNWAFLQLIRFKSTFLDRSDREHVYVDAQPNQGGAGIIEAADKPALES